MASMAPAVRFACVCGLLSLVSAQVDLSSCQGPLTTSDSNILNMISCANWTGDITAERFAVYPSSPKAAPQTFSMGSLGGVVGNLEFTNIGDPNDGPWTIQTTLRSVTGSLTFSNLAHLDMPNLEDLQYSKDITFSSVSLVALASFRYDYNTQLAALSTLSSLKFISTNVRQIGPFNTEFSMSSPSDEGVEAEIVIMDNTELRSLYIRGINTTLTHINIQNNSNGTLNVTFPDIETAILNINSVAAFEAELLNSLGQPDQSVVPQTISSNSFQTLSFPNLNTINGALKISDNAELRNLSFPSLQNVDSLTIQQNNKLKYMNLGDLTGIDGAVVIYAPLDKLDMTNLDSFNGSLDIAVTPNGKLNCDSLQSFNVPSSRYRCKNGSPPSNTLATPASSSSTGSGGTSPGGGGGGGGSLSTGAKAGIGVGVGLAVLLILGAVAFFCLRKRRSSQRSPRSASTGEYAMSDQKGIERSPVRYEKVPATTGSAEERSSEEQRPASSVIGDNWSPPEQRIPTTDGRVELEEQQLPRHEMDARSLPDMEMDDEEEETRSLQDIERAHGHVS